MCNTVCFAALSRGTPLTVANLLEFVRTTVPLLATRNLHGGLTDGKMTLQLENRNSTTLDVLWMETLPWFISLYLHTLNVTVDGFESRK